MKSDATPCKERMTLQDARPIQSSLVFDAKNPAVRDWPVCRMHGAGAPSGAVHPNYRHGLRTKEMQEHAAFGNCTVQSDRLIKDI
jgi:hypothetical protein